MGWRDPFHVVYTFSAGLVSFRGGFEAGPEAHSLRLGFRGRWEILTMRKHLKTVGGYVAVVVALLGLLYGAGVLKDRFGGDYSVARELREAAEQGDIEAQNQLGVMYVQGKGVARDFEEAVMLFRQAAEREHAPAQKNLGQMYQLGQGVAQNHREAVKWNRRAAEQGDARAQYNLGAAYAEGSGVTQDWVKAHMWFNISGTNGKESGHYTRYEVERKMTAKQIANAQKLTQEWVRKHRK